MRAFWAWPSARRGRRYEEDRFATDGSDPGFVRGRGKDSRNQRNQRNQYCGTWRGHASSSRYGGYVLISFTIAQNKSDFSGSYMCAAGTLNCLSSGGTISGTIVSGRFTGVVVFNNGISCSLTGGEFGGKMAGSYTCSGNSDYGSWESRKQ